jgi:hypothetical protein
MNCGWYKHAPGELLLWVVIYLVLDDLPDDPGHLIAVKFHHGVLDLDLLDSRRGRHSVLSKLRREAW